MINFLIGLTLGIALGSVFIYLMRQSAIAALKERLTGSERLLEAEKLNGERIRNEFKLIALETLNQTEDRFHQINERVVAAAGQGISGDKKEIERAVLDMKARLDETQKELKKIESDRLLMYGNIQKALTQVVETEQLARTEVSVLTKALTSSSGVRGSLGEMALQKLLEANGLSPGIDFDMQLQSTDNANNEIRPDCTINLPGQKKLVIDSKEIGGEYVLAQASVDEAERKEHYQKLVQNIRTNIYRLSRKEYQTLIDPEIPYVVMFISNEWACRAAFDTDPNLFQEAIDKKIYLASPVTLIPLIQLMQYGWQQYKLAKNARELGEIVETLGNRLFTFIGHLKSMRDGIQKTAEAWNSVVGSWETKVATQIQRAREKGGILKDAEELLPIETKIRTLERPQVDLEQTRDGEPSRTTVKKS